MLTENQSQNKLKSPYADKNRRQGFFVKPGQETPDDVRDMMVSIVSSMKTKAEDFKELTKLDVEHMIKYRNNKQLVANT